MGQCPRQDVYRLGCANQRTGQLADHQVQCAGIGLSMRCIVNAQDVACILYQSMLKAPSSADERHPLFTGELDGAERPVHAFVRAARTAPEGVEWPQCRLEIAPQRRGWQPDAVQRHGQGMGRMIQGVVGRRVRETIRIMVSYHPDTKRFGRSIHTRFPIVADRHAGNVIYVCLWCALRVLSRKRGGTAPGRPGCTRS